MSTDDSISEDVSSSGALSHCHVSADGDGGKESEASLVSSEGTSASGLVVSEDRHAASQTTGGAVENRPVDITPACNKIRSLCLSSDEAFDREKNQNLPFINPSSLETLRALVQEIQSSGETDPEIWKDCEGRWLHLFQLVEKQYQEQILAQQEQYQCQIQLIQDEIKALVQLQNRQISVQPHADFTPTPLIKTSSDTKDFLFPLVPKTVASDSESLAAPGLTPFSSPSSQPLHRQDAAAVAAPSASPATEERATTVLSSGYGTLSAWDARLETAGSPGEDEDGGPTMTAKHWTVDFQEETEHSDVGRHDGSDFCDETTLEVEEMNTFVLQQRNTSQTLTSWAQRNRLRPKRNKVGQSSYQDLNLMETEESQDQDQHRAASSSLPLRRSDSLMSEASGLTYWRLNESELYRPLPDSFDSSAYLLLQEATASPSPSPEQRLSLREIYHNKQRSECKRSDWDVSVTSVPSSPQVLTLDAASNPRQSDRTSGFTSPSHFSSPSFVLHHHHHQSPRVGTPVSPDSMMEAGAANPGDTDGVSDTSSASTAAAATSRTRSHRANKDEEGSRATRRASGGAAAAARPTAATLDDPVVLSLLRQNLREKHSRHVADLKAYYESEIQVLRDKLKLRDLPQDLEKSNQALTHRCRDLEEALSEANARIQDLEATNGSLEKKLAEWPERYAVAGAAVKSLQQRLEESKRSGKDKDALTTRLKTRVRQLEEEAQKAGREADDKEARREREYKMLQDLLGEYDSLVKEHETAKNNLVSAENKLVDANDQISELKRVISKLESQVKQLEHENQARARFASHGNAQPSGAGLFHHPDLLLSPGKSKAEQDAARRKSPFHRKSPSLGSGSSADASSAAGSWRCASPPECEQQQQQQQPPPPSRHQEQSVREAGRREAALTPMMRALIELEETRATESRAPCKSSSTSHRVGGQRTTVGFVERRHKEAIQDRVGVQVQVQVHDGDRDVVKPAGGGAEQGGRGGGGGRGAVALLKAQRSLSPEGHRSSSLPPPAQRNLPSTTPTKRDTLLTPLSAKSSPKRCPTENYSTAFGHMMPREEHLVKRSDGLDDQRRDSFSPRKKLQFPSTDRDDDPHEACSSSCGVGSVNPPDGSSSWGEEPAAAAMSDLQDRTYEDAAPLFLDKLHSLAEAEKLFDELTQEKLQIEAALSRMPAAGGRVSLQSRLDEVALENRLERLNRELGSIRMTLKRFHVLRSSANI